jgi:lipopolysaccharide transport system permease protein
VRFRGLGYRFTRRDLTLRYRQTFLGVVWVVLQPMLAAGAFTLIFGRVADLPAPAGVPYFVLAFWGSAAFTVFNGTLLKASSSLVGNAQLVSKVYFPRLWLPLSTSGSATVDVTVASTMGLVLALAAGVRPGWALLTLPLWLAALLCLGLAGGLLFAPLQLRYRDVAYILPTLSQLLLYVSPVGYALDAVPDDVRGAYVLNPLVGLIEGVRWAALGTEPPPVGAGLYSLLFAATALVLTALFFRRQERIFADVI